MLTPQSNHKFTAARKRAFIEEWLNYFRRRPNNLLSFDEVKQRAKLKNSAYKGRHEIELDKIVGSTGRFRDFSRTFLPKSEETEQRWRRVHAVSEEMGFPPIQVYKVGEVYFVSDGNHRVSVARASGVNTIEAYVTEYQTSVDLTTTDDMDAVILKAERNDFLEQTRLNVLRPQHDIVFTEPGRYPQLLEHIAFHKYLQEVSCNCIYSDERAVTSWYDKVYTPLVTLIRQRAVLNHFPGRSEADLYAWLTNRRAELEQQAHVLSHIPDEAILEEWVTQQGFFKRLRRVVRRGLQGQHLSLEMERVAFLRQTQLDQTRPNHAIRLTELGGYQQLQEHITFHKYLQETEIKRELSHHDAAASWYDHVYLPLVVLIRTELHHLFAKYTETDLYLWLVRHRANREATSKQLGQIPNEELVQTLKHQRVMPI